MGQDFSVKKDQSSTIDSDDDDVPSAFSSPTKTPPTTSVPSSNSSSSSSDSATETVSVPSVFSHLPSQRLFTIGRYPSVRVLQLSSQGLCSAGATTLPHMNKPGSDAWELTPTELPFGAPFVIMQNWRSFNPTGSPCCCSSREGGDPDSVLFATTCRRYDIDSSLNRVAVIEGGGAKKCLAYLDCEKESRGSTCSVFSDNCRVVDIFAPKSGRRESSVFLGVVCGAGFEERSSFEIAVWNLEELWEGDEGCVSGYDAGCPCLRPVKRVKMPLHYESAALHQERSRLVLMHPGTDAPYRQSSVVVLDLEREDFPVIAKNALSRERIPGSAFLLEVSRDGKYGFSVSKSSRRLPPEFHFHCFDLDSGDLCQFSRWTPREPTLGMQVASLTPLVGREEQILISYSNGSVDLMDLRFPLTPAWSSNPLKLFGVVNFGPTIQVGPGFFSSIVSESCLGCWHLCEETPDETDESEALTRRDHSMLNLCSDLMPSEWYGSSSLCEEPEERIQMIFEMIRSGVIESVAVKFLSIVFLVPRAGLVEFIGRIE